MSVIVWNFQGSRGSTVPTLACYLQCMNAKMALISETRCGLQRATQRINHLPLGNSIIVSLREKSGGLWLLWDDDTEVHLINKNFNQITVKVKGKGPQLDWILIFIYGDLLRKTNIGIWNQVNSIISNEVLSVLFIGDFNAMSSMGEKWGGSDIFKSDNMAFRNWVYESGLIDLGHRGPTYTWMNKKGGNHNINQRLDRALDNLPWTMQHPNSVVYHLPRFNSNHSPILLRPNPLKKPIKSPFRCENWWNLKSDFGHVCEKAVEEPGINWECLQKRFRVEVQVWVKKTKSPN